MDESFVLVDAVEAWEGEGGSPSRTGPPPDRRESAGAKMTGTPSQLEWAEQIRLRVAGEFDRVARAFQSAAGRQAEQDRMDTLTILAILEEKRAEVMANERAGYFIRDWQELGDQVRRMIAQDSRYEAIKANKAAHRHRLSLTGEKKA